MRTGLLRRNWCASNFSEPRQGARLTWSSGRGCQPGEFSDGPIRLEGKTGSSELAVSSLSDDGPASASAVFEMSGLQRSPSGFFDASGLTPVETQGRTW